MQAHRVILLKGSWFRAAANFEGVYMGTLRTQALLIARSYVHKVPSKSLGGKRAVEWRVLIGRWTVFIGFEIARRPKELVARHGKLRQAEIEQGLGIGFEEDSGVG